MQTEFYLHINEQGIQNSVVWSRKLQEFMKEPGQYKFSVLKGKRRSGLQNSYYWCCIVQAASEELRNAGYDEIQEPDDAHEVLKTLFLTRNIPNKDGEFVPKTGSTRKLTTKEFGEYMEQCAKWLAETFGRVVPAPGFQSAINY
jgi:hypothetical protein